MSKIRKFLVVIRNFSRNSFFGSGSTEFIHRHIFVSANADIQGV
jgi:hypothetical protein